MATESTIKDALDAFAAFNGIPGFDLGIEKSEGGATLRFPGATVRFVVVDEEPQAHLPLSAVRVRKLTDEIATILEQKGVFRAQIQQLVGERNSAQSAVVGRVGRVALRPQ